MKYKKVLDWMFVQLPMYQKKGKTAFNAKLDTTVRFAEYLENPEKQFKTIHVAGTNGKGSSCHMLASILQEAGYTVGLYTSPHLKDFRERIKINGEKISKKEVKDFIASHKPYLKANSLSFFEMTVGMAFTHFATKNVDIAVIEVGLGGRLDATNIITPQVSLITNIGLDHTQLLGDTIEKIALEKAGIIKKNVPVVISETQTKTKAIFKMIAAKKEAKIIFADDKKPANYKTDLLGNYQIKNSNGVLAALNALKGFKISKKAIKQGLLHVSKNTGLLGRWQLLQEKPFVICDTAHNKEGLQLVLQQLQDEKFKQLHIVLGVVNDKALETILPLFPKDAIYYFVSPNVSRGLDQESLCIAAKQYGLKGESYTTVKKGLSTAIKKASKDDLVFVGGSTFVVAEIV